MAEVTQLIHHYLRHNKNVPPVLWPGCGHGIVLGSLVRSIHQLGLTKDEVVAAILKRVLHLFSAPERAKYYFIPSVDIKIKSGGCRAVTVKPGMELFIVSRMKREKPLSYEGPEGIIYAVYFQHDDNVEAGQPLIGVCPGSQTGIIQDVVNRVHSDWEERN